VIPSSFPDLRQQLSELVALPSVSSADPHWDQGNAAVIHRLAQWLADLGFTVDVMPLAQAGKANLIARYGSGSDGLVLSGHTDTVPFDAGRWQSDPFQLTERDGRFYGLGSCDMKGFFPLVIEAVKPLLGKPFVRPLTILATADEESSMSGVRALVASGQSLGKYAVIGEPTGLTPIRMHKGIGIDRLSVRGQSGHSSDPALGRSALECMHDLIGEMRQWRSTLQQRYQHPGFAVPVPTLNLGCIHGGDSANRICAACELHFDLRPLPGMSQQSLREELRARLAPIVARHGCDWSLDPVFAGVPPFETASDAQLVRWCEALTGNASGAVAFATEAPFLQALGCETVVMGAGSIDQAHQPDEYFPLAHIEPAVNVLRTLIGRVCLAEGA